jgi:transcriptional regulator with PAS, ATPase and Fis domain
LKGFIVELPPLRERKGDIHLLTKHFMDEYGEQYGKDLNASEDFLDNLFHYDWQGNVRELRNVIRKAATYADSENYLSKIALHEITALKNQNKSNVVEFDPLVEDLETATRKLERAYLKASLSKTNGNVSAASKLAGIGRATFYKKLGTDNRR